MGYTSVGVLALMSVVTAVTVNSIPKYDIGSTFVPSSMAFLEKMGKSHDQMVVSPQLQSRRDNNSVTTKRANSESNSESVDRSQEARFGYSPIGQTGSGYGGVSNYAPTKIDLGGLLLGAIIGVGTILIIPKLLYIFSGQYGSYARSEDNSITQTMTRLDDILARHGIDTTSCMQRAVCSYSQKTAAQKSADILNEDEKDSSINKIIDIATTNQIFRSAMQGTAIQEAIDAGKSGENCTRVYQQCGLSMDAVLSLFSAIISSITQENVRQVLPAATS